MPPNKPYSFVRYRTKEESKKAYVTLNGKEIVDDLGQNITLYLNFVEKVHWEDLRPPVLPPGLMIVEEIVTPEDEEKLLECIDWTDNSVAQNAQKSLKHRKVKHYGYEFCYDNNNVDKDKPLPGGLPDICSSILEKCLKEGHIKYIPDQLTINQYEPGQGIPPHIDTHSAFENEIISLSLGAEIVMDFKHPDGCMVSVLLPQRSLLVMTGESRYLWTHGITPRKFDIIQASEEQKSGIITSDAGNLTLNKRGMRTSFTFRKVRRTPCDCSYPMVCDSQSCHQSETFPSFPENDKEASKLEREYVHRVYEEIAEHFSSTRHTPWPQIGAFLKTLPKGSIVADIGCGNGKYLGLNKEIYMIGCDRSQNLVEICGERRFEAFVCDALAVPIRSETCDACISIAVIHHFATAERRLATLQELARLLRPGGKALIYVWAMEQEYNKQKSKYLRGNRDSEDKEEHLNSGVSSGLLGEQNPGTSSHVSVCSISASNDLKDEGCNANEVINSKLPVHTNRTSFHSQDVLVPWHLKRCQDKHAEPPKLTPHPEGPHNPNPVFHRYYHVFCEGELEAACRMLSNISIQQSFYDQGNWCVIFKKL